MAKSLKLVTSVAVLGLFLQACSSGSGGGGSDREIDLSADLGSAEFVYSGPPPASDEIQNFKREFFDPLAGNDRCGQCHTPGGSSSTHFVDQSDVNNAWQVASTVVNLTDPATSAVVLRVANGHNCWLGASQSATCATTITGYIERWAAGGSASESSEVQLVPRRAVDPSATRVLPQTKAGLDAMGIDIESTGELLDLVRTYCSFCHTPNAAVPQSPYFASSNTDEAYDALRNLIDLADPGASRLVRRLSPEQHNCWDDCPSNASEMEAAVARISAAVPETEVDPALVISKAQILEDDGIIANTGGRFETNVIAKWEFREGTGTTTADTSGVQPEIPLSLSGDYTWMASWGIRLVNGKAQGSVSGSEKLYQMLTGTGEYTIEAWVAPNNVAQENAWIVGYAGGPQARNFLMAQNMYDYWSFNRSSANADDEGAAAGEPMVSTDPDDEIAQATLQHVVVTYDAIEGRKIWVNGMDTGAVDDSGGGLLNNWNEVYTLVLGNDTSNANPFAGAIRMVAIHNAVLTPEQIQQNYDVGVGQKYFLLFSVTELIDDLSGAQPGDEGDCYRIETDGTPTHYCYVVYTVSQFDDASYLFEDPFFANINPSGSIVDFDVTGIRIGVNGKLANVGQAYVNVSAVATSSLGALSTSLADLGTIIPLQNGGDQDIFFLSFDSAEGRSSPVNDGALNAFSYVLSSEAASDIGVRTFDEISAAFSRLTGVPIAHPTPSATGNTVNDVFQAIRRGLPANPDFQAFSSSHQMSATQLASAYCDALVGDAGYRTAMFPSFNFGASVDDPAHDWRNDVAAPLVDKAINQGLVPNAIRTAMLDELELLVTDDRDLKPYVLDNGDWVPNPDPATHNKRDGLMYCLNDAPCPASRTGDVVKAVCTTVLGSAVVMAQ